MENLELENSTLVELDQKIKEAETGEEAKKYAEAYKALLEADTLEWREAARNDVESKKGKLAFWGTVIAGGIGAAIAAGIKVLGDLAYQRSAQEFEDQDAYVNYRKHKR